MSGEVFVVAYEGDDRSVLDLAIKRAKGSGAKLHIVHILEWSPYSFLTTEELAERHKRRKEELVRAQERLMDPALAIARQGGVEADGELRYGSVVELLAEIAEQQKAAFVFVGRSGTGGIASRVFGSVPIGLAQVCKVPVVIVP